MKIAITGANGFVGSCLYRHLSEAYPDELRVHPLVRPGSDTSLLSSSSQIRYLDYSDPDSIQSALGDCDIVVHNAGLTKAISMQQMYLANVAVTSNVLKAINVSKSVKQFIYISSQAASRPSYNGIPVTETDKCAPLTWYGKTKLLAELSIKNTCQVPWTIIRPCSVYGEGEKDFLELFKLLGRGLAFQAGDQPLNLIHVEELCEFISLCLANDKAENQIFFATNGANYLQSELIDAALSALDKKAIRIKVPAPVFKVLAQIGDLATCLTGKPALVSSQKSKEILSPGWICSCEKAQLVLGWEPRPHLYRTIRETILWYQQNGYL